jgi:hypothetical protein
MKNAEALIIGLQLIVENRDEVINSKLCSGKMKVTLNNLSNRAEELIEAFWGNLSEGEELYY